MSPAWQKYHLTCASNVNANQIRISHHCPHEEILLPWLSKLCPVRILIRLREDWRRYVFWSGGSYGLHCPCPWRKLGYITKTCLYNFDPLKPHFYIVKLRCTGVCIIFLISAQNHRLWVLVRTASASFFFSENCQFLEVKFSIYLYRRVFVLNTVLRQSCNHISLMGVILKCVSWQ